MTDELLFLRIFSVRQKIAELFLCGIFNAVLLDAILLFSNNFALALH